MMWRFSIALLPVICTFAVASPAAQRTEFTGQAFTALDLTTSDYLPGLDRHFGISLQWRDTPIDNFTTASLCLGVAADLGKAGLDIQIENQVFSLNTRNSVRIRLISPTRYMQAKYIQWGIYAVHYALVRRNVPFTETAVEMKLQNVVLGYLSIERNDIHLGNSSTVVQDLISSDNGSDTVSPEPGSSSLQSVKFRVDVEPLADAEWLGQDRVFINLMNAVVGLSGNGFQRNSIMRYRNQFVDVAATILPPVPPRPYSPYNTMKYSLLAAIRIPRPMSETGRWVSSAVTMFVDGQNVGKWILSSLERQPFPYGSGRSNLTVETS